MIERWFERRTSLIVDPPDGRIPWTAEGRQRQAAAARMRGFANLPTGPEELTNDARCLTWGMPRLGGNYGSGHYSYYQIVQTPGYVVMAMEYVHEARIIPLDTRPHLPSHISQWGGDSRGRWEGQSLVVETTNFASGSNLMGATDKLAQRTLHPRRGRPHRLRNHVERPGDLDADLDRDGSTQEHQRTDLRGVVPRRQLRGDPRHPRSRTG